MTLAFAELQERVNKIGLMTERKVEQTNCCKEPDESANYRRSIEYEKNYK